jgi:hypothetical protein
MAVLTPQIPRDIRASNVRQADQYLQGGSIEATESQVMVA